jgi:thiol-disulfide isomerase/thioredoxin
MPKMIGIVAAVLGLASVAWADDGHHHEPSRVTVGDVAPLFGPVPVLNAKEAGLAKLSFRGGARDGAKVWLISFFATWCPGCVNELPLLVELNKTYGSRGLRVATIGVDREPGAGARLRSLLAVNHAAHPVVLDPEQQIVQQYQGRSLSLPCLYLVGPDGKVALVHEGFDPQTAPRLKSAIEKLLK